MKFKTKSMIATFIILFISGSAFLAGFLQEYYSGSAADLRKEAESLQTELNRMENRVLFINQKDDALYFQAEEYRYNVYLFDLEYDTVNNTLDGGQRWWYIRQIVELLNLVPQPRNHMLLLLCFHHFRMSHDDYIIASKEDDGYELKVTWNMWSEEDNRMKSIGNPGLVSITNASGLYGRLQSFGEIQALPLEERPIDHFGYNNETFGFPLERPDNYIKNFLYPQVVSTQQEIEQILTQVADLESQAATIGLGVAMTTVAVVLSTAMANRLNQRKIENEFEKLREEEGRVIEKSRDLISIPTLIIAIILSVLGVIFPIILNLFGI